MKVEVAPYRQNTEARPRILHDFDASFEVAEDEATRRDEICRRSSRYCDRAHRLGTWQRRPRCDCDKPCFFLSVNVRNLDRKLDGERANIHLRMAERHNRPSQYLHTPVGTDVRLRLGPRRGWRVRAWGWRDVPPQKNLDSPVLLHLRLRRRWDEDPVPASEALGARIGPDALDDRFPSFLLDELQQQFTRIVSSLLAHLHFCAFGFLAIGEAHCRVGVTVHFEPDDSVGSVMTQDDP